MYEFHGWINVVAGEAFTGSSQEDQAAIAALTERLREAVEQIGGWFEVRLTFNGRIVVVAHGLRNHRQKGGRESCSNGSARITDDRTDCSTFGTMRMPTVEISFPCTASPAEC